MTRWIVLLAALWIVAPSANAVLQVEITQGVEDAVPVAVVPFGWQGTPPPEDIGAIVAADLRRSGYFKPIATGDFLSRPTEGSQVQFKDWRMIGAESLVVGSVRSNGSTYEVRFQLFDVFRGNQLVGFSYPAVSRDNLRRVAHRIADVIYENLTGQPGAFATRIAYVVKSQAPSGAPQYSLQVADSDGHNPATIVNSKESIISPSWSPDGRRLAYASFESGRGATVFVQDLSTGQRTRLLDGDQQVSAPAWSPDGRKLAVVIADKGSRDIYIVDVATRAKQRVTRSFGTTINTEPTWTPDGRTIAFTSDLGGQPQIYEVPVSGGRPKRITFEGRYNARPTFSRDGKTIAMVHEDGAGYHIAVLDRESGNFRVLTDPSPYDESPSIAPNGSMILYATRMGGRGVLAAVSADGRVKQRLAMQEGTDAREPAWGPYLSH